MSKTINNTTILTNTGKPWRIPVLDDDGEMQMNEDAIDECEECGRPERAATPKMGDADAAKLLRMVIFSIPESIQAKSDSARVSQAFNQIERAENGRIAFTDKVYEWLHRTLNRDLPRTKKQKDEGVSERNYAMGLFSLNADFIVWQLKDIDSRGEYDYEDEAEDTDE